MQLIDIGANLTHQSFHHDLDEVLARARDVGIAGIMVTGTDVESSLAARALSQRHPSYLRSTAGFHPHVASDCDDAGFAAIAELIASPEVVAVGETGLDYNRNYSPREAQLAAFERHLELAAATGKPMFLHQRDAHEDFIALLRRYRDRISGGVVHCFTDSRQALQDYLALDMYIGITGWVCDERRGLELQESVADIPADRLLIETDAPYLLPRSLAPKPDSRRNEPAYLIEIVSTLARCTGRPPEQVAQASYTNARRLFGLDGVGQ